MDKIYWVMKKAWHKLPYTVRHKLFLSDILKISDSKFKKEYHYIINKYGNCKDEEIQHYIDYIKKKKRISPFNDNWTDKYGRMVVKINRDNDGWPYCNYNGKRMYLKKSWTNEEASNYVKSLLIEQDRDSPHRYITKEFQLRNDEVVYDVGASEGNFSLEVIEKCKQIVLIEYDDEWIEALHKTFKIFKDKIKIVKAFVGDGMGGAA